MALFNSGNPFLKEKAFEGTIFNEMAIPEPMTLKGTVNKFGFLMLMMIGSTVFSWSWFYKGGNTLPLMMIGIFGGLAIVLIMAFKKSWSPVLAPAYALLEGLFVGSVSAIYNYAFEKTYPGLIMQAVLLTLAVTVVMFIVYKYRIIKVTEKFRAVISIAILSVALFYLAQWIWYLITGNNFAAFTNAATPLGIGFSILMVGLASLKLLLDFDTIEKGVETKAPKYMEWYSATGLLITLVWLYLEILRLLSKLSRR